MLIACIGPDVFRALEKARELEAAFRQKHDPEGTSIEQLTESGADLIDELTLKANTVSLFTPMRFLRVRNLLTDCPKGRLKALEKALSVDPEHVVVVSVETEPLVDTTLKMATTLPKWVRYDFPRLEGSAFEAWIRQRAQLIGYTLNELQIREIVDQSEGDSWQASLLVLQVAAGTELLAEEKNLVKDRNIYELADAYLRQDADWRQAVEQVGPETVFHSFLGQLRAYQRVKSGQDGGVPSFVVRKLKGLQAKNTEERFVRLIEAMLLQRQGYLKEDELSVLF